jgi:hypothetical protein
VGKPKTREAMRRAGLNQAGLAKVAGLSEIYGWKALGDILDPERAGAVCRSLGELAGLTAAERKAVFAELIHAPGRIGPLAFRVSTEDPKENLLEAAENWSSFRRTGHHEE